MSETSTIGIVNYINGFQLADGSIVNINLIDTAGQEKYKSIVLRYYSKADCCLLVYDISDSNTFDEIKSYYNPNLKTNCQENIKVILLGNKTDLEEDRQVSSEEASDFALENNYVFMESSCLNNTNVANAFVTLIEIANREKIEDNQNNNIKISSESPTINKKSKCGGGKRGSMKANRNNSFNYTESNIRNTYNSFDDNRKSYISEKELDIYKKKSKNEKCF